MPGVIQQFGTPDEVFDDPENLFVADFVGEPKINLVPGTVERRGGRTLVHIAGAGVVESASASATDGQEVMVGIRPHDAVIVDRTEEQALRGTVVAFENLLEFGQATVQLPGFEPALVLLTEAHAALGRSDEIAFSAPAERVYLFDREGGARVR